ncbi:MAG: hypothetical protein WC091_04575 [Sulfuricellaceae bacterium]
MNRLLRIRFARYNLHAINGAPSGARAINQKSRVDAIYGGLLKIAGTVTVNGLQAKKRVLLLDRKTGQVFRSTVAAADGGYLFDHLRAGQYCVLSFDDTLAFNAQVADNIEPE